MPTLLWVRALTVDEADRLNRWRREGRGDTAFRCVWLSAQRRTVPQIAQQVGVTETTVRTWLKRFNARGIVALTEPTGVGRHPRVTPAHVAVIRAVAAQDPRTLGLPGGRWSRSTLARYLTEERGIAIKRSRLHDILRIAGISLTEPSGAEHDLVGLPAPGDL